MWNLNGVHAVYTVVGKMCNTERGSRSVHRGQKDVQCATHSSCNVHRGQKDVQHAVHSSHSVHRSRSGVQHGITTGEIVRNKLSVFHTE